MTQSTSKPKIYMWCVPINGWGEGAVIGYALAEDGHGLCSHLSSNEDWSKHDMGLHSNWHHDTYQKHYPEGFELEWIDDTETHQGFLKAFAINQKNNEDNS